LEKIAGPSIRFLGRQSDEAVVRHAARCRALLFPGEEDFGMTPLEVNAAGRPVIAFRAGGAVETVVEGRTGIFFDKAEAASLMQAIKDFESFSWNVDELRAHAAKFDRTVFAARLTEYLQTVAPIQMGALQAKLELVQGKRTSRALTAALRPAEMAD
jgi:glycosyltransferase involved in cell wall biosynthesis